MRKLIALCLLLGFGVSALNAQQTAKKDGKPAKKVTAAQPAADAGKPKPSPEIQKLAKMFNGRWKVSGKIQDEMWAKGGDEGSGIETVNSGPGGFTAMSDAKMTFKKMGPMTGHGVTWYDESKKAYQGFWCDNWSPTCMPSGEGKWDGDKLVFVGDMMMGPQTIPVRQTYSGISANGFDWSMEAGDGKGNWKPEMSLKYERASAETKK
jgi:hypothetical protein